MKIALAQTNPTIGAFEKNAKNMLGVIKKAKKLGADLVVFPELSLVGYPPLDLLDKDHFVTDNLKYFKRLVSEVKGIACIVGYIDKNTQSHGKPYQNTAALISNGKVISKHCKTLLPSYDVFDETRHFEPAIKIKSTKLGTHSLAISICEDIWNDKDTWQRRIYKKDPLTPLLKSKTSCLINISASPYSFGKYSKRNDILCEISKKHKTPTIYVNQVGSNDELIFDGASFALNSQGKLIAQCHDFKEDLVLVDLEKEKGTIHPTSRQDIETAHKALVLGVKDYVQKCGFQKVLVGLSGGIDSALTAALATEAIGASNVLGIMMPSRYSSKASLTDAKQLAKNLRIHTKLISIEPIFTPFLQTLLPLFKEENSDVTQQNMQARIRGNILMALSNQWGRMLLSTGNKSEMATGYCTLYGDMSGGLAVLSDVPKTLVYKLATYLNRKKELIPKNIIKKAPSAELRPNQTDQQSLPPYNKLDKIISAYVEKHESFDAITKKGFSSPLVKKVITMIDGNEYKRRQAPPGLRITHKAFGIGRRLPIAQKYREFY